jgi:glucosamine-6-phosphate deaminase
VALHPATCEDVAPIFAGYGPAPTHAVTMGLATILEARALRVLAFGARKAQIVRRALSEPIGPALPASFLRTHPDVEVWLDGAAAAALDR